jgi:hypothetical protein
VSSIFDSLTGEPLAAGEAAPEEEPPPEVPGLDMSMLGRPLPQASPRRHNPLPASEEPASLAGAEDHAQTGAQTDAQTDVWTGAEPAAQAGAEAEPAHDDYGAGEPAADPAPPAGDFDSPPFPDSAGRALYAGSDAASGDDGTPGAPAMPPFLELPGMGSYADGSGPPPFLEPLERGRPPPQFTEEAPESLSDLDAPPAYPEPFVSETANETAGPEPIVTESAAHYAQSEAAARPMFDAAGKIEAEANATSVALDNLKRLLDRDVPGPTAAGYVDAPQGFDTPQGGSYVPGPQADPYPDLDHPVHPPAREAGPRTLLRDPSQFAMHERAPLMPLPVPPEEEGRGSIYLLGFLTGLGLSLMAGLALYILINTG